MTVSQASDTKSVNFMPGEIGDIARGPLRKKDKKEQKKRNHRIKTDQYLPQGYQLAFLHIKDTTESFYT